jgi:hypothetical protein
MAVDERDAGYMDARRDGRRGKLKWLIGFLASEGR